MCDEYQAKTGSINPQARHESITTAYNQVTEQYSQINKLQAIIVEQKEELLKLHRLLLERSGF